MKRTIITVILTLAFTAFAIQAVEQTAFSGAGIIHSTTGGFKFPDGSVQLSAITPPCTAITYLPFVILDEGVYCLTDHLETSMTSGNAIEIQADNVVIELNGWMLENSVGRVETLTRGIRSFQRKNITIRNGTIRGFYMGVSLSDSLTYTTSQGHLVEDIHAVANTFMGIRVLGSDNTVRRNRVFDTGGSIDSMDAYGFYLRGPGLRVLNNDVSNVTAWGSGRAYGIYVTSSDGGVIEGNRINDLSADTGSTFGIYVTAGVVFVDHNHIANTVEGVFYYVAGGKYRDNLTLNVTTPFTGGIPIGIND